MAVESVAALARWIAELTTDEAAVIGALQVANEPALNSPGYMAAVQHFYRRAVAAARVELPNLPLVLNFIYPNDKGLDTFMNELQNLADVGRCAYAGRALVPQLGRRFQGERGGRQERSRMGQDSFPCLPLTRDDVELVSK